MKAFSFLVYLLTPTSFRLRGLGAGAGQFHFNMFRNRKYIIFSLLTKCLCTRMKLLLEP